MKFYRFTNYDQSWWVEYRTSGMENSITEKVTNIYSSNGVDLSSEMIQKALPVHLGDEVTQVGLVALAAAQDLTLTKRYESNAASTLATAPNYNADFLTYSFAEQTGAATIDEEAATIDIEVANGTSVVALVATFTLSSGASAAVGVTPQVSETTANDFTDPVEYVVTAEDGHSTKTWTVTVTVAEA